MATPYRLIGVNMHRSIATVALVLALGALGACGEQGGDAMPRTEPTASPSPSDESPTTPAPSSVAPSGRPSGRANNPVDPGIPTLRPPNPKQSLPTDYIPGDTLGGRVTKGGSGPCYGLVTDDEVQYALHSTAGIKLEEGTYVRVKVAPLRLKIYCGPGAHLALLEATKL
jgi:hypothetical protein